MGNRNKIVIDVKKIQATSLDSVLPFLRGKEERRRVQDEPQYRTLIWLSHQFDNISILDLGTRKGTSAVCLADNEKNSVDTYDNRFFDFTLFWQGKTNLFYHHEDCLNIPIPVLHQAKIIYLDLWHTGVDEAAFLPRLNGFEGLLIMDDIDFPRKFPLLKKFWDKLPFPKVQLPESIGHQTGTGIIPFGRYDVEIK